ncbi:MAG: LysM peptidoglycan-binding domain-containing protein [Chloroflexi bacterium]|nr:LysM peptidoglycan-binding domain-containing protein [Chloroflexota bacterium]
MKPLALLVPLLVLSACLPGRGGGAAPTPTATTVVTAAAAPTVAQPTPVQAAPTATASGNSYTVKSGDTLSGIAGANNTTVDAIVKANNMDDPNKLQVGQKLIIPAGSAPAGTSSGAASASSSAVSGGSGGSASPTPNRPPPP